MLNLTPKYQIEALANGKFTITREGSTFSGNWTFDTHAQAVAAVRTMEDEAYYMARAEAAYEDYCDRHDYD